MLSVDEALERLLAGIGLTDVERCHWLTRSGAFPSTRHVTAEHDVPPFANSAMDGYALRSADAGSFRGP